MAFSLATEYPFWFIILCIACGMGYSAILYFRNASNGFGKRTRMVLAILRAVAVALIAFLLLNPLLKDTLRRTEKPIVVLAMDNSESILVARDSNFYRNELTPDFNKLANELGKKFDVQTYSFSDQVYSGLKGTFNGKQTDISKLFLEINTRYSNRNLAAVVLASDGVATRGTDPIYSAEKVPYSIYSVALGDTSQHRDLLIARVNYNRIVYLGNNFPLEITLSGYKCTGARSKLSVFSGNTQLYSENIIIGSESYTKTSTVMLSASVAGVQRFRINIDAVNGEISKTNNFKDIFVEVLDGRQKVLIVSASPHPDIHALKEAIEKNKNYEVETAYINEFSGNVSKYSLIILHQIPSVMDAGTQLLSQMNANQVPVLYILGHQSNLQAFNALQSGLIIPPSSVSFSSAYPLVNSNFSQFSINPEISGMILEYPPLQVPFGQYKSGPSSDEMIYQKIGSVSTAIPLILFNQGVDRKSGVIAGEGIWRWRLTNFLKSGNHQAFDELVSKMVQYLSVKTDKSQFRILMKNNFSEDEAVVIDAELYNDSYELVNDPDASIVVTDRSGKNFPFTFSRNGKAYYLNAGSFPAGDYTYKATASYGGKSYQKAGSFIVMAINEEMLNTIANHNLLATLSSQHNGEMVDPRQIHRIVDLLKSREDIKTVTYSQKKYTDLINIAWILLFIVALFATEWFIRKRNGGY